MKNVFRNFLLSLFIIGTCLVLTLSCNKDDETIATVTDKDGNVYHTVKIGTQIWMVENLRTTKYNDGTPIPLIIDDAAWDILTTPAYCWYNNDKVLYGDKYGALYNWHAVSTGKLSPSGWRVATDADWSILTDHLGGESVAGSKLKEMGTTHWNTPNTGATNEVGFYALPGGVRYSDFSQIGNLGYWWTSSEGPMTRRIFNDFISVRRDNSNGIYGLSVRCIKN